jgi:hypothetical protein
MFRLPTQLLIADKRKRSVEVVVLDDRGLRDLANFIKGPIRQFDAAISDRQPTVRIIDDGDPLADRRLGLLAWLQNEDDLVVLPGRENRRKSTVSLRQLLRSAMAITPNTPDRPPEVPSVIGRGVPFSSGAWSVSAQDRNGTRHAK